LNDGNRRKTYRQLVERKVRAGHQEANEVTAFRGKLVAFQFPVERDEVLGGALGKQQLAARDEGVVRRLGAHSPRLVTEAARVDFLHDGVSEGGHLSERRKEQSALLAFHRA
jgi:hypothetical protein